LTIIHGSGSEAKMGLPLLPLLCIIVNAKSKSKNGVGLGTRLGGAGKMCPVSLQHQKAKWNIIKWHVDPSCTL